MAVSKHGGAMRTGSKWEWLLEILAGLFVLGSVFFAPLFQWFWFGLFVQNLPTVLLILLWIAVVGITFWRFDKGTSGFFGSTVAGAIMAVVILLLGGVISGATNEALYHEMHAVPVASLSNTAGVRYLPLEVAEKYGENKVQVSNLHAGTFNPIEYGDEITWVAPRVPTGLFNILFGKNEGFIIVKHDGSAEPITQTVKYGEDVLTNNVLYFLRQANYFAYYPEVYWAISNDEVVAVAPYITYKLQFPLMIPEWGGVMLVHANGVIENLTPNQAIADKRLNNGVPLFPAALARMYGDSVAYKNGMWNKWFNHVDEAQVTNIDGSENQMPYLVPNAFGPSWFMALKPYGDSAQGTYKLLDISARDGSASIVEFAIESSLIGPNRAASYVHTAFPDYNWEVTGKDTTGNIKTLEPRPLIRDAQLYWLLSVTTSDFAGVSRSAIVNANSGAVVSVDSYEELLGWLAGTYSGRVGGIAPTPTPTPTPSATPAPVQSSVVISGTSISNMTDQQLIELIRAAADELKKRQ